MFLQWLCTSKCTVSGCDCVQVPEWQGRKMGDTVLTWCYCARRCTHPSPDVPHPISLKTDYSPTPFLNFPPDPPYYCLQPPLPHSFVNPPPPRSPLLWHPRAIVAAGARSPRGSGGGQIFIQLRVTTYGLTKREGMEEKRGELSTYWSLNCHCRN